MGRNSKEGDRDQNCRESSDQGEDTCNKGVLGRGLRNSEMDGHRVGADQNEVIGGRKGDNEYLF